MNHTVTASMIHAMQTFFKSPCNQHWFQQGPAHFNLAAQKVVTSYWKAGLKLFSESAQTAYYQGTSLIRGLASQRTSPPSMRAQQPPFKVKVLWRCIGLTPTRRRLPILTEVARHRTAAQHPISDMGAPLFKEKVATVPHMITSCSQAASHPD